MEPARQDDFSFPRIIGIDLHRVFFIFGITVFHITEMFYYRNELLVDEFGPSLMRYYRWFYSYIIPYSGLVLVGLTFFLIGYQKQRTFHWGRFALIFLGVLLLGLTQNDQPFQLNTWEWDVYQYLFLSYALVLLLPTKSLWPWFYIVLSTVALAAPPDSFVPLSPFEPGLLNTVFFGAPGTNHYHGWNLIPWFGLPLMFFSMGLLCRREQRFEEGRLFIRRWEYPVLVVAAILSVLKMPEGLLPLGSDFPNYTFNQPPEVFWSCMLRTFICLRLYLDPRVNAWLHGLPWARWVSNLQWSRRFGICYATSIALLHVGYPFKNFILQHPRIYELYWFAVFIGTELIVRFTARLIQKKMFKLPDELVS